MNTLCWIRRDLRIRDHRPLQLATRPGSVATVCFVFDQEILRYLPSDDRRLTFIHASLEELDQKLRKSGSRLVTLVGDPVLEIPKLCNQLKIQKVFAGEDFEPNAKKRDAKVGEELRASNIEFELVKDQVVFSGSEILNNQGEPYRVFTPFKKRWLERVTPEDLQEHRPNFKNVLLTAKLKGVGELPSLHKLGFQSQKLVIEPGEESARKSLKIFLGKMERYQDARDLPAVEGTSVLSPHFRFGTLSVREAFRAARANRNAGSLKWMSELIWREFYQMILDQYPHVAVGAFQKKYDKIVWPGKRAHFMAWCRGETGFPIVDAAMIHFNETGWMHNRLRMIVASFLVKDLLIDWREGEAYFAKGLLDFDLASNNGGWQWAASTGVDAQPYFRIFNPSIQAKRFDPRGHFIGRYLAKRHLKPIVDHSIQAEKAVELFRRSGAN